MNQKLLYRVCEVAEFLSLSRSKTYELVRSGAIRASGSTGRSGFVG